MPVLKTTIAEGTKIVLVQPDSAPVQFESGADGGGGSGNPLPRTYWVSPLAVGSTEDGSAGNPFLTPQAAIDVLEADGVGGVLLLACSGSAYNAMSVLITSVDVAMIGFGNGAANSADRPFLAQIRVAGTVRFSATNLGTLDLQVDAGTGAVLDLTSMLWIGSTFRDCTLWRLLDCDANAPLNTDTGVTLREAVNCRLSGVGTFGKNLASGKLVACTIDGSVNVDALTLLATSVDGDINSTTVVADVYSYSSFLGNGGTLTGDVTLVGTDFNWQALTSIGAANGLLQPSYTPVLMPNADATITASQGSFFDYTTATPPTANRVVTLGTGDSPRTGITLAVRRFDQAAFTVAVQRADTTPLWTFATGESGEADFTFNGTDWDVAGVRISQEPPP